MNKLLTPIREKFETEPLKSLVEKAYPSPGKPVATKQAKKKHPKQENVQELVPKVEKVEISNDVAK